MGLFDGAFTGFAIGTLLSAPAFLAELFRHRVDLPLLVDVRSVWGREVPAEDVLSWSALLFLAVATAYGAAYPLLVSVGVFRDFGILPLAAYSVAFCLAVGLVAAPALGLGIFARREGRTAWLEIAVSSAFFCLAYWYAANFIIVG